MVAPLTCEAPQQWLGQRVTHDGRTWDVVAIHASKEGVWLELRHRETYEVLHARPEGVEVAP